MPIVKRRHDHIKVYRPTGTRYASGTGDTVLSAIIIAELNYRREFGDLPKQEERVYEIVGGTFRYSVDLFEIHD